MLEKGRCLEANVQYFGDYKNTSYRQCGTGKQKYDYDYEIYYVYGFFKQYQVPIYAVPFIIGTTGNIILLIIFICNKNMRTVPNMYILNFALSDIIYLTVFFSEACANRINDKWLNNEFVCVFVSFFRRMSVGLSAYSVALYSFQRYRVIVRPFQVRVSSQTKRRGIVATFCGVWLVAALFAVPSTLSKYLCQVNILVSSITYYQHVVIFELFVSCILPLTVIAFSYINIVRHLVESSRSISEGIQNPHLNTRINAAKIVVGLAVVFVISYVPYHVFWAYFICSQKSPFSSTNVYDPYIHYSNIQNTLNSSDYKIGYTYLISTCFLTINSCLNPVALFCTSSQFRHLKRYFTCFCKTSSPSDDFELARIN